MKTPSSIFVRMILLFSVLLLVAGGGIAFLLSSMYSKELLNSEKDKLQEQVKLQSTTIQHTLSTMDQKLLMLAATPPFEGIIRASENNGIDPYDASSLADWKDRLTQIFKGYLAFDPQILQVRYILMKTGKEILRVDRQGNVLTRIPEAQLQYKKETDYVQGAAQLASGLVFVSGPTYNREHGKVVLPPIPVLRTSTPVYDLNGNIFGILVINSLFSGIQKEISQIQTRNTQSYLINEQGDYLYHQDSSQSFLFEKGLQRGTLQHDFPKTQAVLQQFKEGKDTLALTLEHSGEPSLFQFQKVLLGENTYLILVVEKKYADVMELSKRMEKFTRILTLSLLFLGILGISFFAKRLTAPLEELTASVEKITKEHNYELVHLPQQFRGEVGVLLKAFKIMLQSISDHTHDLRINEERLRLVTDNIPGMITFLDKDLRYLFVNRALEKFFMFRGNVLGQTLANSFVRSSDYEGIIPYIKRSLQGETLVFEWKYPFPEEVKCITTHVIPYKKGDETAGVFILMLDHTKRKQAENELRLAKQAAETANVAKTQFLANMSHEIRTPLNAIMGFSQIMMSSKERASLSNEFQEYLGYIYKSGEGLTELINDILDLAKIEAGKMELSEETVRLKELVQGVYHLNRAAAMEQKISYRYSFDPELPEIILADRGKLKQVLTNLLGNAIKFTPEGKQVRLSVKREQSNRILFTVEDEGVGVEEDRHTQIFEPFEQADNSVTRKFGGTGLGLALCKNMVFMMNGEIGVKSTLGKGSRFFFWIPLKSSEVTLKEKIQINPAECSFSKENVILVVEDNADNRLMIMKLLKTLGLPVFFAENGVEGVESALELKPDLILMDMHMPKMDGLEATRCIRDIPEIAETPIVALSADVFLDQQEEAYKQGINDYLTKPLELQKLLPVLQRFLKKA